MRPRLRLAIVLLCALTLSVCASGGNGGVKVALDEFTLDPDVSETNAGPVRFDVENLGAVAHEFIVLEADRPVDRLPVKDGIVRLRAPGIRVLRSLLNIDSGESRSATVRLQPGRYALICNTVGHYQSGMSASFRVTSAG
jgi:uncharacterized cupredoxin-like copper-binding protein